MNRNGKKGCRRWLTRKAMLPYFQNDAKVVDAIILRKESDPQLLESECRDHPECPGPIFNSFLIVYYVPYGIIHVHELLIWQDSENT